MEITRIIERVKVTFPEYFKSRQHVPYPPPLPRPMGQEAKKTHPLRIQTPKSPQYGIADQEFEDLDSIDSILPINAFEIGAMLSEETDKQHQEIGTEAIAYYAPFHLYFPRHWGVYVIEEHFYGMVYLIHKELKRLNYGKTISFDLVLNACLKCILEHEYFHFRTEFFGLIYEDFANGQCYAPYLKSCKPYCELEEALATACEVTKSIRIKNLPGFSRVIRAWCQKVNLPGYRDFAAHIEDGRIKHDSIYQHALQIMPESKKRKAFVNRLKGHQQYESWFPTYNFMDDTITGQVPLYFFPSSRVSSVTRLRRILANKRAEDLLNCLRRKYNCKIESAGVHQLKIVPPQGRPIPFRPARKGIQDFIVTQAASALKVDRKEILQECLGIKLPKWGKGKTGN